MNILTVPPDWDKVPHSYQPSWFCSWYFLKIWWNLILKKEEDFWKQVFCNNLYYKTIMLHLPGHTASYSMNSEHWFVVASVWVGTRSQTVCSCSTECLPSDTVCGQTLCLAAKHDCNSVSTIPEIRTVRDYTYIYMASDDPTWGGCCVVYSI